MYTVDKQFQKTSIHNVGVFEVNSEKLMISDPCYSLGTWCQGILDGVRNGKWAGATVKGETDWGNRVWELRAVHTDYPVDIDISEKVDMHVGVDSGQAGIFDLNRFKGGEDEYGDGGWYDQCCTITSLTAGGGVLPGGVVSSSGFGDGGYDCYVTRDNGKIIATKIVFIMPEDDSYEDDMA